MHVHVRQLTLTKAIAISDALADLSLNFSALSCCIQTLSTDLFVLFLLLTARSKRAGTGKSMLTPVPTPAEDRSKAELCSDGEPVEDSDYDTDLEFEEPREDYDPTG